MNAINEEPEPDEIEALLPWHAAGTLSPRDADRVEQALAGDRELARQYDLVREELIETIHLNETLGAPSVRAMDRLFAAIDAEEARAPRHRRWFDLGGRISEFLSSLTPRTLAWSATAAAVAILMQAAVIAAVVAKEQGSPPSAWRTGLALEVINVHTIDKSSNRESLKQQTLTSAYERPRTRANGYGEAIKF